LRLRVTIREKDSPLAIENIAQLSALLDAVSKDAQAQHISTAIILEAENANTMTIVLGGTETVLSFDEGGPSSRQYASRGASNDDEPIVTCFLNFRHHTEFSRKYAVPLPDGVDAVKQFLGSGELPTNVRWEEV
jgi:hypothetical protein